MTETLWTIQTEEAFAVLQRTGVLRTDPERLLFGGEFRAAYDWMAAQMCRRVGPPPVGVAYPVWAWYQWEGRRKRMDQRRSGYAPRGTPMVQLTFEADPREFLRSDFDAWHLVLGRDYIADSERDWEQFRAAGGDASTSWDKIFDLTRHTPGWDCAPEERSIQATLWELKLSQVRKAEHFIAK